MFESFMVALNAVAPFIILLSVGYLAVRMKITDQTFMNRMNTLNFRLFFPFLMFNNIYSAKPENLQKCAAFGCRLRSRNSGFLSGESSAEAR